MENKSKKTARSGSQGEVDSAEVDNVDKIRDILFGNQMREVDQRFAGLEKSLAKDLAALRNENAMQIESLKTFIESEIELLGSRLAGEEAARIENVDDLEGQLKQQVKQIDRKIAETNKALDKNSSETNQKILKQSQDFSKELGDQIGESRERMDTHRQELSAAKVDKLVLGEVLSNMALQINPDDGNS